MKIIITDTNVFIDLIKSGALDVVGMTEAKNKGDFLVRDVKLGFRPGS